MAFKIRLCRSCLRAEGIVAAVQVKEADHYCASCEEKGDPLWWLPVVPEPTRTRTELEAALMVMLIDEGFVRQPRRDRVDETPPPSTQTPDFLRVRVCPGCLLLSAALGAECGGCATSFDRSSDQGSALVVLPSSPKVGG